MSHSKSAAGKVDLVNAKPQTPGERGLPKRSVGDALVTKAGVQGDFNVYRHEEKEDDPDSALLIFPAETILELNEEGWPVKPGDLGENLTTSGIPYSSFAVGKTFRAGGVRFQVSRPCEPCDNLFLLPYVGRPKGPEFLKTMLGRRGWYARVLTEGRIRQGDPITEENVSSRKPEQRF
ncbi:MAG: MOSC domain-containing protein [Nitrososphaerota archaeon]|nr:MOSC domain-containing protein [Nitrososphaerota archaeon]